MGKSTFFEALAAREDLAVYGTNAHLLLALEIEFAIEDIQTAAESALTDGSGDKKCDLLYVDRESGRAVIAQGYVSKDETKSEASANKASDLNTAVSWLLGKPINEVPEGLRPAASELREALETKALTQVEVWYCHNLPESHNVGQELSAVQRTLDSHLSRHFPNSGVEIKQATEFGRKALDRLYQSTKAAILIQDEFTLKVDGGYHAEGDKWTAYCTSVPAAWLAEQFKTYGTELLAGNVRDYLGSTRSANNINNGIKRTAKEKPERFWAYNNGITALVRDFAVGPRRRGQSKLTIKGLSVVNGAQTSGALMSVAEELDLAGAYVMARFVKTNDSNVVHEITQYNNSQNKIEAADFRSNDEIQEQLRRQFQRDLPDLEYRGGRRGGTEDTIRRPRDVVPHYTAAQALAAYHGDPVTAYNERSKIWDDDNLYSRFFGPFTSARHIAFCYSLLRAIEKAKRKLAETPEEDRTEIQKSQHDFFRGRGSHYLLMAAISESMEITLGKAVPDPYSLVFTQGTKLSEAEGYWEPMLAIYLSFTTPLSEVLGYHLKDRDTVASAIRTFTGYVNSTHVPNKKVHDKFAKVVEQVPASKLLVPFN